MNAQQLKEFVALEWEKKDIEERLNTIKKRLDQLEQALVPQFCEDMVDAVVMDGREVKLKRVIHASSIVADRDLVVQGLKDADLAQYCAENYNSASVSKWVREIAAQVEADCNQQGVLFTKELVQQALPAPLQQVLRVAFVMELATTKTSKGGGRPAQLMNPTKELTTANDTYDDIPL